MNDVACSCTTDLAEMKLDSDHDERLFERLKINNSIAIMYSGHATTFRCNTLKFSLEIKRDMFILVSVNYQSCINVDCNNAVMLLPTWLQFQYYNNK